MPAAMEHLCLIEMNKAAFIMRGTAVLKGGVKAVKNGITFPKEEITFSYLSSSVLWPDFFMFISLLHLIRHLSFKESEFQLAKRLSY